MSDDRPSTGLDSILMVKRSDRSGGPEDQQQRDMLNVCQTLLQDPSSPVVGDDRADVTIVEFFDYQCPYCKTLGRILGELETEYDLRIVYSGSFSTTVRSRRPEYTISSTRVPTKSD